MYKWFLLPVMLAFFFTADSLSQDIGRFSGNFQLDAQTYAKDSVIDAPEVDESILSNAFLNLYYYVGDFEVAMRYESYLNPILGFDSRYKGSGIAYRQVKYKSDFYEITAGDFYEQFGSGLIFRAYEERALGYDNAVDGLNFKLKPTDGIELTALIGRQRNYWDKGDGIVRGGDIRFDVNSLLPGLIPEDLFMTLGGSVISKYQADREPIYKLPENVLAYSTRLSLATYDFTLDAEYAYKFNDPSSANDFSFNPGNGLLISASYFKSGFSLSVDLHRVDNMDFRSDRAALGNDLQINYIPPLTRQHAYKLASIFPYATQLLGEAGAQAELTFLLPEGSALGGEYGTTVNINYSRVHDIERDPTGDLTYDSPFFSVSDRMFFQDINIDFYRRWTDKFKTQLTYINLDYDKDVLENEGAAFFGMVNANIVVLDMTQQLAETNALRMELQHVWADQDSILKVPDNVNGNWAMALLELTLDNSWFLTFYDEYNYGNDYTDRRIHYLNGNVAYLHGATRLSIGYGRQRGGIICVGGVCRPIEASNGFTLSVSSSF